MALNIAYLLRRAAAYYPQCVAVEDGTTSLTLAELLARGERLANALDDLGIGLGASVGVLSDNRTGFVLADVAIAVGGRVRVALNARLHLEDFRFVAADADLRALFYSRTHGEAAEALAEEFGLTLICLDPSDGEHTLDSLIAARSGQVRVRPVDDEDPAWITYTSGTTGRPKGIVLSHRAIREVAVNLLLELAPVHPGEQILLTQAISHASGYLVLPYLLSGAGVYLQPTFDPEQVWVLSRRPSMRTLKAVPSMLEPLLNAEAGKWGFETIIYGASSIPQPVLERCLDRYGPIMLQDYGQSEAPMTITCLSKLDHLDAGARLSAGRPWRTVAVEVRGPDALPVEAGDVGEVYVQGSHMMTGYHKNPEATADVLSGGWLRTKDLARVDDRGFVYLQGRNDEMINSGGYNISPREVEDVLVTYLGVGEVVVLGMPDQRWGDSVTAVIRPSDGSPLSAADIIAFARPRLGMRAPKRVEIWDEIPRTSYGKVDRAAVRIRLSDGTTP
jgi:fatty-acyl-CoA synthase